MADPSLEEKTEEPTPRRLEQARRQGQIAVSRDLNSGLGAVAACVALIVAGPSWTGGLVACMRTTLSAASSATSYSVLLESCLREWILAIAGPVATIIGVVILVGLVQTRGVFSLEPIRLNLTRIVPSRGRLMGCDAWADVAKELVKIAVIGLVGYSSIRVWTREIARLDGASASRILLTIGETGKFLGLRLAAAMVVLGCADYGWRIHRHRKSLRMSRDEVRREHKETEGDPAHRAERDRLHGEILQQHALVEVESADLVVVERGVCAVAVRYDRAGQGAPVVSVKGERRIAQKIEAVARIHQVPIVEHRLLAHALLGVEEGGEIPDALYESVAELLAKAEPVSGNSEDAGL